MKNLPNLTQSSHRNHPINRRMKGYSFRNFRRRRWSSRCKFSLLSRSNFDLKCSIDAETSLEHPRTNGTRNNGVYKEYFRIEREPVLRREERFLKKNENHFEPLDEALIAINGRDHAPFRESSSPRDDRPIADERSRYDLILCVRRDFVNFVRWILIVRLRFNPRSIDHERSGPS